MKNLGLLFLCFLQFSCSSQQDPKINGVSFVASREKVEASHVSEVTAIHANYAAVMPYGFIRSLDHPTISFNTDRQWFGETKAGMEQCIEMLEQDSIKVMLKPHIWVWKGEFTGKIAMSSEESWKELEESYHNYIITYAKAAEETNTQILCIGTELEEFIKHRPEFWSKLIKDIKKVYSGKLTYAANWDEYTRVPFWGQLDYVGVDAYFPLTDVQNPTEEQMRQGWQKWKTQLADFSKTQDKPILFTEFGYRSMDFTAKKPWLVDRNEMDVNFEAQANAFKAVFGEFWNEDWFAGGFVWKWFIHHERSGGAEDNRFTPQNKPAQQVISEAFKIH